MHTTTLVIYVIEVDSVAIEYRLPCDKVLMIKSLIGLLSFACSVIVLGRAIPRSVISSTCGHPYNYIRLTCEAGWTFTHGTQSFNITIVHLYGVGNHFDYLKLFTDASGSVGFAAVLGKNWFASRWVNPLKHYLIAIKKLFQIVLAIEIWRNTLFNKKILFMLDNMAVVYITCSGIYHLPFCLFSLSVFIFLFFLPYGIFIFSVLSTSKHLNTKHLVGRLQ